MTELWYVDSSVLLRAIIEGSRAARQWFVNRIAAGDRLLSSRLMELEVRRVARAAGIDSYIVETYLDEFLLISVDDSLLAEAAALPGHLSSADAIHVASAMRIGTEQLTLVTHDRQMAVAAVNLGFTVIDPVNDPHRRSAR